MRGSVGARAGIAVRVRVVGRRGGLVWGWAECQRALERRPREREGCVVQVLVAVVVVGKGEEWAE